MANILIMVATGVVGALALIFIYVLITVLYNTFFHPLRRFPGPFLAAATPLPLMYHRAKGKPVKWIQALHTHYGSIVRLAPNELSFIDPEAWDDIYGHRTASKVNKVNFAKDSRLLGPDFFVKPGNPTGITRASDSAHTPQRRLVSPAFSDKALKDQEPLLRFYVDLLISKLRNIEESNNESGQPVVDLVKWYNFTTFDIMADLTFGEPLHMLDRGEYTQWVRALFSTFKLAVFHQVCQEIPILAKLLAIMIPNSVHEKRKHHLAHSIERVNTRLATKTDRPDIWTYILRHTESEETEKGLSLEQMYSNASTFMIAGTETTATQLSGLTYQLLKNPKLMEKLTGEIRAAFPSPADITMQSLAQLENLNACLEEGLRFYPPVAVGTPRIIPEQGAIVCGQFIPAGTVVSIAHYSAYHAPSNFHLPDEFLPERWNHQPAAQFAHDKKHVLQPFSFGPRNCVGRNLAYHEMRLVLANVLWNFDFTLCDQSEDWIDQDCYFVWEKRPLWVKLKSVQAN